MAASLKHILTYSPSSQLQDLLNTLLSTVEENRDVEFYTTLKSVLEIQRKKGDLCDEVVTRVNNELCLPVIHSRVANSLNYRQKLHLVYEITALCCAFNPKNLLQKVVDLCVESLEMYNGDVHSGDGLPVEVTLDLVNYLLKQESGHDGVTMLGPTFEECLFESLLSTLRHSSDMLCAKITGTILQDLLSCSTKLGQKRIKAIWALVKGKSDLQSTTYNDMTPWYNSYTIICGLANFFFNSSSQTTSLVSEPEFWRLIQHGVRSKEPLSHKRSMYLLKLALDHVDKNEMVLTVRDSEGEVLFYWSPKDRDRLLSLWQEFVLLMETIEESQAHVVRPVLPRVSKIIAATQKNTGSQALAVSWLVTIFIQASQHDNKFIRKWAVLEVLTIDLSVCPLLDKINWPFIMGKLQSMLNEYLLYGTEENCQKGEGPIIGKALKAFYQQCVNQLPDVKCPEFLCRLIKAIDSQQFIAVPMVFVSEALANISPFPAWNKEALQTVQNVLSNLRAHAFHLRVAIEGFLLKAVTRLYDQNQVEWKDVHSLLSCTRLEEFLGRGSYLWLELGKWLWNSSPRKESCIKFTSIHRSQSQSCLSISEYAVSTVKSLLESPLGDVSRDDGLMHMVVAASDACHAESTNMSVIASPLQEVLGLLMKAISQTNTHVYAPEAKGYHAVELLSHILRILNETENAENGTAANEPLLPEATCGIVSSSVRVSLQDVLNLSARKMTEASSDSYLGGKAYLQLCQELHGFISENAQLRGCCCEFDKFVENVSLRSIETIQRLQSLDHHTIVEWKTLHQAMLIISWACEISNSPTVPTTLKKLLMEAIPSFKLNVSFTKPDVQPSGLGYEHSEANNFMWSNMVSKYIVALWSTVSYYLANASRTIAPTEEKQNNVTLASSLARILEAARDGLDLTYAFDYPIILKCLGLLIPMVVHKDIDLCVVILDVAYKTLKEAKETEFYWENLDEGVPILFSGHLMNLPEDHPLTTKIKGYWKDLLKHGSIRVGIMSKVIHQLSSVWGSYEPSTRVASLRVFSDVVLDACLFGPALQKSKLIEGEVDAYLCSLGEETSLGSFKREEWRDDTQVRVTMINTLLSLDPSNQQQFLLLKDFTKLLLAFDVETISKKPRSYQSSPYHRLKHRVWQSVLVLISIILRGEGSELEFARELLEMTLTSMLSENQTSIKNYHEWTVLIVLSRYSELHPYMWNEMKYDPSKRLGRMASLITITTLLAIHQTDDQTSNRVQFMERAISAIFPWVTLNHRTVRATAHVAVQRIWEHCKAEGLDKALTENPFLKSCLEFMADNNDNPVEKKRVLENYFFFDFHPFKDFSIETIYHILPRLSDITDEEWVAPTLFKESSVGMRTWKRGHCHGIPLFNPNQALANLAIESYPRDARVSEIVRRRIAGDVAPVRTQPRKVIVAEDVQATHDFTGDVQKKIIAWKLVPPEDLMMAEMQQQRMIAIRSSTGGELVVVASLINKAPNLGGLCRTCEIFGAKRLVLGSNEVMNDPYFKGLSVSSSKWVDIEQVRPAELNNYLDAMRHDGYSLIGVEQTANSKRLTDFTFPHKTLLLLGNEKEGIPVELIQQLDACVEIPQVGVIRSLNVHVSGALLIWEYTKQCILSKREAAIEM